MKITNLSATIALVMFITGLLTMGAATAQETSEFTLLVGEQRSIDVTNIANVSIGERKVATATLAGSQLILTGKGAGITTLTLIGRDDETYSYTIRVLARDPEKVADEVEELLSEVEGVEIKVVGDRVYIDGFVYREIDQMRVERIVEVYEEAVDLTTFSKAYLTMRRMINVNYHRYEIQRTDALAIGLNWSDFFTNLNSVASWRQFIRYGDPLTAPTQLDPTDPTKIIRKDNGGDVLFTSDFNPIALNQDDDAFRLLDQHQIVVKDGGTAEYHVGGEYPIVYVTQNVATVQFKEYGAIFAVTPEIDRQDNVNVELDMTLSELDFSVDALGFPGLFITKQISELNLKSGETIVLGGYNTERRARSENGIPGLNQIPVLGYLFGQKDFRDQVTEGVVFITPSVASPTEDVRNDPKIRAVLDQYEQEDFRL